MLNLWNKVKENTKVLWGFLACAYLSASHVALAAVPDGMETKLATVATDITAIGVMVSVIILAVIAVKWLFKMIKMG